MDVRGGPGSGSPLRVAAGAREECDGGLQQAWQWIQRTWSSRGGCTETGQMCGKWGPGQGLRFVLNSGALLPRSGVTSGASWASKPSDPASPQRPASHSGNKARAHTRNIIFSKEFSTVPKYHRDKCELHGKSQLTWAGDPSRRCRCCSRLRNENYSSRQAGCEQGYKIQSRGWKPRLYNSLLLGSNPSSAPGWLSPHGQFP